MGNKNRWSIYVKGLLTVLPFIIGFMGFINLQGVSWSWAAYYAIRLYGLNTDVAEINSLIEFARWTAPIVTATALLLVFKDIITAGKNRLRALKKGSCSVYGEGEDAELLLKNLGNSGIRGKLEKPVPSMHHVLLMEDHAKAMCFFDRNKKLFVKEGAAGENFSKGHCMLHICVKDISGMAIQHEHMTAFSMEENCSRLYWQKYGAKIGEKIALIGDAVLCDALLEQGLMVNIFSPDQQIAYHVWEPERRFEKLHLRTNEMTGMTGDTLCMHMSDWREELGLLGTMDRVILCGDMHGNLINGSILLDMVPNVNIHMYARQAESIKAFLNSDRVACFGQGEELLTREVIIKESLTHTAKQIHKHYKERYQGLPAWEGLSIFQRRSNMSAASFFPVIIKLKEEGVSLEVLTELEHIRWCRFYYMYNWQHGAMKDWNYRTHPSLVPYDELSREEKDKDKENVLLALSGDFSFWMQVQ